MLCRIITEIHGAKTGVLIRPLASTEADFRLQSVGSALSGDDISEVEPLGADRGTSMQCPKFLPT